MAKFFFVALAAMALAACGTGTPKQISIAHAQVSEEHPVLGTLVVSAPSRGPFPSLNAPEVFLDNQLVGTLPANTILEIQVEPKIHRLHIMSGLVSKYKVDQKVFGVDPGQTVHYSYETKSSSVVPIFGASGVVMAPNNTYGLVLVSK